MKPTPHNSANRGFISFSILGRIEGGEAWFTVSRTTFTCLLSVSSAGSKGVKLDLDALPDEVRQPFSILGRIEGGEACQVDRCLLAPLTHFQYPRPDRRG